MGRCLLVIACYSNQMNSAIAHAYLSIAIAHLIDLLEVYRGCRWCVVAVCTIEGPCRGALPTQVYVSSVPQSM